MCVCVRARECVSQSLQAALNKSCPVYGIYGSYCHYCSSSPIAAGRISPFSFSSLSLPLFLSPSSASDNFVSLETMWKRGNGMGVVKTSGWVHIRQGAAAFG